MARILTGIQSTGTPHLGNLIGAVIPADCGLNEVINAAINPPIIPTNINIGFWFTQVYDALAKTNKVRITVFVIVPFTVITSESVRL